MAVSPAAMRALPIIAVDQGSEAIFVRIHAYLNPFAISQPISRLNPGPRLQATELSSQDFCGRPVSIQVPYFLSAAHQKSDEPFIVVTDHGCLQNLSCPPARANLYKGVCIYMPRAKKTSDSSTARKNSRAQKAPVAQSPGVNPGPISVAPPTEEQVRLRAYELFLQRGGFWGNPEQDWFQAEAEVRASHVA